MIDINEERALGVPAIIGCNGINDIVEIEMTEEELAK